MAPIAARIERIDFRNGIQEGRTCVLHERPAIGHVDRARQRLRRRFAIAAAAVTCDYSDVLMIGEPCLDGRNLPVRQQCNDPPPLQITYNGAVAILRRKARSSMPTMLRGSVRTQLRRRITRNRVSWLTGTISRLAMLAAGLPPSASPKW